MFTWLNSGLGLAALTLAQPPQEPRPNTAQVLSDEEYDRISRCILDRIFALKTKYRSLIPMTSARYFEFHTTWALDDPTKLPSKLNGRHETFGQDGYWFSLEFYRGKWQGAAVFRAIEFGDLNLWFSFGHGGNATVIQEISTILREENEAFCKKHPWQPLNTELSRTGRQND